MTETQTPQRKQKERLFNIPPMTGGLLFILLGIHLIRLFGLSDVQNGFLLFEYSFIPHRLSNLDPITAKELGWNIMTMFTYMGFHIGWTHFFLNTGSLLAFGTAVERTIGAKKTFLLFILCGFAGAVIHFVAYPQSIAPVVGASAAVSGLFAAVLRVMQYMGRFKPGWRGLLPIIVIWTGMNVVFGLMGVVDDPTVTVAWLAHIGGFAAGLGLLPLFAHDRTHSII